MSSSQFMFVNSRRIGSRSRRSPYDRSYRRRRYDHPFILGLQATITSHSDEITIINVSSRDLVERALRQQHVPDYINAGSSPNFSDDFDGELLFDDRESELFDDQEASTKEKEDDAILLGCFKTRIFRAADGVNNPTETCAICQAEFEHEESIGTLGCGHEYHTGCIKQWLMRKKDCPMCRTSVLPLKHSI